MRDFFNGCWGMSIFFWLKERGCWKWGFCCDGVTLFVCFIFFLKLAILDLTLGDVFILVILFFISRCKICVFLIRFFFILCSFCGGYRSILLGDLFGAVKLLSFFFGGSVFERLLGWICLVFDVFCFDRYIVGAVFFFLKDEEDEERMFITIEVLYRRLEDLESFCSGVILLDVDDVEECVFFLL